MASEDVIELGSSDDEAEPAPKKSKPMPNAMVCIPRNIHEVTIRPSKLNLTKGLPAAKPLPAAKGVPALKTLPVAKCVPASNNVFTSKEITIVKGVPPAKKRTTGTKALGIVSNPFANRSKTNGKPVQKNIIKPHNKMVKPIKILKASTSHPNVFYATAADKSKTGSVLSTLLKKPNMIQNNTPLNNLPAGITVRKTTQASHKPIVFMKTANQIFNPILNSKQVHPVQTVELDDDECTQSTSSPAWYLRPEEQTDQATLEQENNAEPEVPTMIEITIEDSPIKPALNKRTCEIGAELAITIDDSPVKPTAEKNPSRSGSDDEEPTRPKECNSKKKLEYPKDAGNGDKNTLEIDIDYPFEVSLDTNIKGKDDIDKSEEVSIVCDQLVSESSKKHDDAEKTTPNTNSISSKENKSETKSSNTHSEFHSVYQSFIDTCFQLENSEDMEKIVEKKIKAYYRQVPKEYSESEEFVDMVASKILAMKASPEKMYLYIKDIVDELNMQRKMAKSQIVQTKTEKEEPEQLEEEREYDTKRQRQIRKLEKTIKKLHRAIQKLEEQEVDFDDEDDSVYLLTERYKERMVRVYAKFCQLTNTKMPSEPRILIDARPGQPSGPAKRLEKWINKKVPIGTPLPFPDFHDVIRCVREANEEDKLCWNEADIMEEARDLFTRCGKKLQRRRQENEWRLAASRIAVEIDPAQNNEQLKSKLDANRKIAATKETEIFNKYVDRQNQLKLEAEEIGDKEADESPVESEEEEANDESVSLENKDKRKERLKRLIQEISKGPNEGKESQSPEEPAVEEDAKKPEENEEVVTTKVSDDKDNENKVDSGEILEKSNDKDLLDAAEALSVSSDNSNDLESDVDELHLLQKLHSGNEAESSTLESSDSDGPIAISDSIESGSDTRKQLSDVISIENSSYSESEADKVDNKPDDTENTENVELVIPQLQPNKETEAPVVGMETDSSNVTETCLHNDVRDTESSITDTKTENSKSNNNEYNEPVEDILLASSDEETVGSQEEGPPSADSVCINLKDDLISIDETIVGSVAEEPKEVVDKEPSVIPETVLEKVINVDDPSFVENSPNDDHFIDTDSKDTDKTNAIESISLEQSQEIASSATMEEGTQNDVSIVSDDTKAADTITYMDVDVADMVLKENSTVDNSLPPPSLTSKT